MVEGFEQVVAGEEPAAGIAQPSAARELQVQRGPADRPRANRQPGRQRRPRPPDRDLGVELPAGLFGRSSSVPPGRSGNQPLGPRGRSEPVDRLVDRREDVAYDMGVAPRVDQVVAVPALALPPAGRPDGQEVEPGVGGPARRRRGRSRRTRRAVGGEATLRPRRAGSSSRRSSTGGATLRPYRPRTRRGAAPAGTAPRSIRSGSAGCGAPTGRPRRARCRCSPRRSPAPRRTRRGR